MDVYVEKGVQHKHRIVFESEGDQGPTVDPGDIIVILAQKPHHVFIRDGDNLLIDVSHNSITNFWVLDSLIRIRNSKQPINLIPSSYLFIFKSNFKP